jgi:hypothetical protein
MSIAVVKTIRDAIIADAKAAWSLSKIHPRPPRTEQTSVPYAWVIATEVAQESVAVRSVEQTHVFEIGGRFAMVDDPQDAQITKADAMIARLMAATAGVPTPSYASVGMLPIVTNISFSDVDDPQEAAYEVVMTFTCLTHDNYA